MSNLDKLGTGAPGPWGSSSVSSVQFATEEDLLKIVELESASFSESIFAGTELLFSPETIRKYFSYCPEAFRVVYQGSRLVGFSIIYPLNQQGIDDIMENAPLSILSMKMSSLHDQFDDQVEAIYLEDVATVPEAPNSVRLSLLKDLVKTTQQYCVPLYATPITSAGMHLINRRGFTPLKEGGFGHVYICRGGLRQKKMGKKQ